MKEHFVITVGREYGSGGREIAKFVAQKLNVPFYDKELLTLAAQTSGICQEIFEHNDEKTRMSDMLPVTAGSGFGAAGEGYFRLSAFNSRANIEEACRRLVDPVLFTPFK